MKNNNKIEQKHIINTIYQQPSFNKELDKIEILIKSSTMEYTSRSDAKKAYDLFNRKRFMEFNTPFGVVSFNLLSAEIVNIDEYEIERSKIDIKD